MKTYTVYDDKYPVATVEARNEASAIRKAEREWGVGLDNPRVVEADIDPVPACSCGWVGQVAPGASGQRCPDCGNPLW